MMLPICTSVHCIITFLVLFFLGNIAFYRERETNTGYNTKVTVALLSSWCGYLLLIFLMFSLSSIRYIKSTEGLVEAFRKLRTSGTAAHGGTPPAGRPNTAIFLGTACQSIPQCPTIPRETNGLKQQQLQTAWILVFLLLLFEKIICIPPPKHPSHLGDFFVFCLLITARRYVLSALATSGALHGLIRKFFVCLELPVFASSQTEEPTLPLLEGIISRPYVKKADFPTTANTTAIAPSPASPLNFQHTHSTPPSRL